MAAAFSLDYLVVGILDAAPEGILLADREGLILEVNQIGLRRANGGKV